MDQSERVLDQLTEVLGAEIVAQAESSLARLVEQCAPRDAVDRQILLPFGGGKDSAWTLAYVRLMQLLLRRQRQGRTFRLHVLFMVHPGVPLGVFENVTNVFAALGVEEAPEVRVYTTTLGGEPIELKFGSITSDLIQLFREEVLISGHLSQGNGRETFCNACNFVLMNAIARYVVAARGAIDFVITGDSKGEVLSYWKWVQKTASLFALPQMDRRSAGWGGLFGKLSEINQAYYAGLLGEGGMAGSPYAFPHVGGQSFEPPRYFGVFGDTSYEYWAHQSFLEDFLGFRLREDAFNFTESDCRNPLLMAHLRGLLADFEGRGYLAGVQEYLHLVNHLMARKSYSSEMIERALHPYQSEEAILRQARLAEEHAWTQYRITPDQLRAMVASPLTDSLERLEGYLRWSSPENLDLAGPLSAYLGLLRDSNDAEIDAARSRFLERGLGGEAAFERSSSFVTDAFGLSLRGLRLLLARSSVSHGVMGGCASELEIMRSGDPHQMALEMGDGSANRIITGR